MPVATGPVQYFVRDKTSDPLGRWSSITLAGRNQRRIRMTTAYNVCSNSKPGISTANFKQYVILLQTDPEPNPRKQFLLDLDKELATSGSTDHMLDASSDVNQDPEWTEILAKHKLYDVHAYLHGTNYPRTFHLGKRKLYHILISDIRVSSPFCALMRNRSVS